MRKQGGYKANISSSFSTQHPDPDLKMAYFLLLVMLTACAARPEDLSAQMFTFPEETNTSYVRLNATQQSFSAVTVCLRFFTDLNRAHSLFSLATPTTANGFQIRKSSAFDVIDVFIGDQEVRFGGLDYMLNKWSSICSAWDVESGLVQLWYNGMSTVRKFVGGSEISDPLIFLGQDPDTYGEDFESTQSFLGMISDVHMWDYPLSTCEVQNYVDDLNFTPGNVLNWGALEFSITGRVLREDKFLTCH